MNPRDALQLTIQMGEFVGLAYINDLSDEDLMRRAAPGINHINWQLGHLIASEHEMLNGSLPGSMPPLPQGFAERYAKDKAASDNPADFASKAELLRVYREQREAMLTALGEQSDEALDKVSPEAFRSYAPTLGAVFALQGSHWLMHCGQWAVVRRQLGRPPLF
ncbi:MAG: DinB family protein [Planctomyces sp.]|nr:DinB family protein [Planctomyces sp.]